MSTPTDQTFLERAFDDGRYPWARTRRVRRRLVVAEVLLVTVLVAATVGASAGEGWSTAYFVALAVGLLGFVPLHSMLNIGIRGLFDRRGGSLDEHQRQLRDESYTAMAWWQTGLTFAAWTGGIALLAATDHLMLAFYLGFLLWFASGLLAYWHLAWTLPDEE